MKPTLLLSLLLVCLLPTSSGAQVLRGDAIDQDSGEVLYTEIHSFESLNDKERVMISRYITPTNEVLGERQVIFAADQVTEYQLNLNNYPYRESVKRNELSLMVRVSKPDQESRKKPLAFANKEPIIIDAGINQHIIRNWDTLVSGEAIQFYFPSTARMALVKLRVKLDPKLSDDQTAMFSMNVSNPLLRALIAPVKVGFYRDTHQLAYYRGPSNIKNAEGKSFKIEIAFENGQLDKRILAN